MIPITAPADLYSNSTLAINPSTGKLVWYYQHLPGDDWDEDYTHERTLLRTAVRRGWFAAPRILGAGRAISTREDSRKVLSEVSAIT